MLDNAFKASYPLKRRDGEEFVVALYHGPFDNMTLSKRFKNALDAGWRSLQKEWGVDPGKWTTLTFRNLEGAALPEGTILLPPKYNEAKPPTKPTPNVEEILALLRQLYEGVPGTAPVAA